MIAIVTKDIDKLNSLMDNLPKLADSGEIDSALHLIEEATKLVESLKEDTQKSMVQMKKNIDYLNTTNERKIGKFDISL